MKKSCTGKESKVVSTTGTEYGLNEFREASKDLLTEEQLLINKKLLESGIEDENLGWLEKRNIYRTIAASLDSKESKGQQRSSPRLTKTQSKWLVNSFENFKNDKTCSNQESQSSSENSRAESPILSVQIKKTNQGVEELKSASTIKTEVKNIVEKQSKNAESQNILKSTKKVHFIKVELEGYPKQECQARKEPKNQALKVNKKRVSSATASETSKKLKMEETKNGISSEEETPLKIQLEMEKRKQNAPFKLRDIKSIVEECEVRNEKWKETYLKNPTPARWGTPIVKNCEKWDGKQIPQKLLHRYQKYLSSNNLTHPVFYPVKSQSSDDLNETGSEMGSQSLTGTNSECRDESDVDSGGRSFMMNESNGTLENNLAASTSGDTSGRMVLRSRNQQKPIILDEEECSSDEFDDWCSKQKSMKKKKTNGKNKKTFDQNNKQLFLKLEKCMINKRNGNESGRKNGNKNDVGFTGDSVQSSSSVNQDCKPGPDPDTMVCPICSLRFKKQLIESHATECASKTYKD